MLVECGLLRVELSDGRSCTFRPSLGRIAALDSPSGLVDLFGRLHGAASPAAACEVLSGLCDPEDLEALPALIGEPQPVPGAGIAWAGGAMEEAERVILAQHLLVHGMVGKARPGAKGAAKAGQYADRFNVAEYVAAAIEFASALLDTEMVLTAASSASSVVDGSRSPGCRPCSATMLSTRSCTC